MNDTLSYVIPIWLMSIHRPWTSALPYAPALVTGCGGIRNRRRAISRGPDAPHGASGYSGREAGSL